MLPLLLAAVLQSLECLVFFVLFSLLLHLFPSFVFSPVFSDDSPRGVFFFFSAVNFPLNLRSVRSCGMYRKRYFAFSTLKWYR